MDVRIEYTFGEIMFFSIGLVAGFILIIMLVNIMLSQPKAKECVKNGGEPYYFVTNFECRNNMNIEVKGA